MQRTSLPVSSEPDTNSGCKSRTCEAKRLKLSCTKKEWLESGHEWVKSKHTHKQIPFKLDQDENKKVKNGKNTKDGAWTGRGAWICISNGCQMKRLPLCVGCPTDVIKTSTQSCVDCSKSRLLTGRYCWCSSLLLVIPCGFAEEVQSDWPTHKGLND